MDVNRQSFLHFAGEGPVHRNVLTEGCDLVSNFDGINTVHELGQYAFKNFKNNKFLGTRSRNADGTWGGYNFLSYGDVERLGSAFGSALRDLGLNAQDFVGIYSINRSEWVVTMLASVQQSMPIVPLYDTLGPDAVKYIVNHAELSTVVCSAVAFPKLATCSPQCPSLKRIILMDAIPSNARSLLPSHIELYSMSELIERGSKTPRAPTPPTAEDLFCIMYTSGTTGDPKGVMLTHRNVVSSVGSSRKDINLSQDDMHISYLPMAHIYEMVICMVGLSSGCAAGFWRGDILGLMEDIQALRPTLLVGVPRVFNRIYDKVLAGVGDAGKFKQMLFNYALSSKLAALQGGATSSIWDKIVFQKIKDLMGGRIRYIVSGSAPLGYDVQMFLRTVTGALVKQGYGLTETTANGNVQMSCDPNSAGHVGPPSSSCEMKLVDVPEMGYFSRNVPQRGEICIRGHCVFKGYYKAQDKTDEVLTKDGWFHTGDIGEWQENGVMKIIDRKKNIFKLAQGEYVAVEMIETILIRAKYVMQLFVHGDSLKDYLVAIVVPDAETVLPWARQNGLPEDMTTLAQHPRLQKLLYDDLVATATASKLNGFQIPRQLIIEPNPWTIDNGLLTPSMKAKRPSIKSHYQAQIDEIYNKPRLDGVPTAKL